MQYTITDTTLTDSTGRVFDLSTVYYREDGSFVLTMNHETYGDIPFHVPNSGKYATIWELVNTWREENEDHFTADPDEVTEEEDTSTTDEEETSDEEEETADETDVTEDATDEESEEASDETDEA